MVAGGGGTCMVAEGDMRGCWGGGGVHRARRDTVNERAVRILLDCILVDTLFKQQPIFIFTNFFILF